MQHRFAIPLRTAIAVIAAVAAAGCGSSEPAETESVATVDDWCGLNAVHLDGEYNQQMEALLTLAPAEAEEAVIRLRAILDDANSSAPAGIEADVTAASGATGSFLDALADADYVVLDVEIDAFRDESSADSTYAASQAIRDYTIQNCATDEAFLRVQADPYEGVPDGSTIGDYLALTYVENGFTADEADCVVANIDFDVDYGSEPGSSDAVFERCGLTDERLTEIQGQAGE